MIYFICFLIFVIIQRIAELIFARRNEKIVLSKGAVLYDKNGYRFIVAMHVSFFISLIVEFIFFSQTINKYWYIFLIMFLIAQLNRYWAITSLGVYWNTKVLVIPGGKLVHKGPYKFYRHPNYISVITELAVIPLIFSCYFTAIFFSILNLFVLRRRIKIEDMALGISKYS
ncbi:MAG: isoprenylcysteine carboxyl methyltransferase [Ignavibacteriae bacterium]|nr:MAG: isoprenylcysteine carboxyl methyltransferase [Ignavibacteriota bacterium]